MSKPTHGSEEERTPTPDAHVPEEVAASSTAGGDALLCLRDARSGSVIDMHRLPATIGFGPDCDVPLSGPGGRGVQARIVSTALGPELVRVDVTAAMAVNGVEHERLRFATGDTLSIRDYAFVADWVAPMGRTRGGRGRNSAVIGVGALALAMVIVAGAAAVRAFGPGTEMDRQEASVRDAKAVADAVEPDSPDDTVTHEASRPAGSPGPDPQAASETGREADAGIVTVAKAEAGSGIGVEPAVEVETGTEAEAEAEAEAPPGDDGVAVVADAAIPEIDGGRTSDARAAVPASTPRRVSTDRPESTAMVIHERKLIARGLEAYRDGRAEVALRLFRSAIEPTMGASGATESAGRMSWLLGQVTAAVDLHEEAVQHWRAGRIPQATDALAGLAAQESDVLALSEPSVYYRRLSDRVSEAVLARMRDSVQQDPSNLAYLWAGRMLKLRDNAEARALRRRLDRQARERFAYAYRLEAVDLVNAVREWNRIIGLVGPESYWYQRAVAKLNEYEQ